MDDEVRGTARYGNNYFCAKVKNTLSPKGEIYVMADRVEVTAGGDLVFWGSFHGRYSDERVEPKTVNLAVAKGDWHAVFAASLMDGHAVAVEHWDREVVR